MTQEEQAQIDRLNNLHNDLMNAGDRKSKINDRKDKFKNWALSRAAEKNLSEKTIKGYIGTFERCWEKTTITNKMDSPYDYDYDDWAKLQEVYFDFKDNGDFEDSDCKGGFDMYIEYLQLLGNSTVQSEEKEDNNLKDEKQPKNIILYGPPGTGKTYSTAKKAMEIINGKEYPQDTAYTEIKKEYDINLKNGRIQFVTFHQSYGYEDFIEGIKAKVVGSKDGSNTFDDSNNGKSNTTNNDNKNKGGNVFYDVEDGIFKKFCDEARKNPKEKPYVFIIDEINRGNISKIFGELITLIEETKRESEDEAMSTTLPYSGKKFSVPSNVYIIGTMNTADRSIAVVDTALRRRFTFEEMMPDPDRVNVMVGDINIKDLLTIMNKRITVLRGREHTIGHSFFIKLKDKPSMNLLGNIFKNKIIPLLQEYFFDDYENIRLVLGDNQKGEDDKTQFIIKDKMADDLFGKEGYENNGETVCFYKINGDAFNEPEAYRYLQKPKPNDKQEDTSGDAE